MANKNIKIQQNNGEGYDTLFPHTLGGIVELTGYTKPASTSAISEDDSVNTAIGKLEKGLDGKVDDSSVVTTLGVDNTTIPTSKAVSDAIAGSAMFKNGSGTFTSGETTYTVTDAFITADTMVIVSPTSEKLGSWSVESSAGSFTITSDATETNAVTFDWGAVK